MFGIWWSVATGTKAAAKDELQEVISSKRMAQSSLQLTCWLGWMLEIGLILGRGM